MKLQQQLTLGLTLSFSVLALSLQGCDSDSDSSTLADEYHGVWERAGYGTIFSIEEKGGSYYEFTQSSCLKTDYSQGETADLFAQASVTDNGQKLALAQDYPSAFPVVLSKRASLPAVCDEDQLLGKASPSNTFEHFVQSYADYYAFFAERGINWPARVAEARAEITDDISDEELFAILSWLIEPIKDGHVQLNANGEIYRPVGLIGANQIVVDAFEQQTDYADLQTYANAISAKYWQTIGDYLDEHSVETFDGAIPNNLIWGTMGNGTVGYLYISNMAYLADEEDGLDEEANTATMQSLMPRVMADLKNTNAMIVDIRNNGGGHDTVSQVIASYFVDQRTRFGAKFARSHLGDTATVESYIEPATDTPYLNPVALITGIETASAAESFTLAMKSLTQVTTVGENTNGILSDVLEKKLPNGWEFWLANEVYLDNSGVNYEVTGIAPEIQASVFSLEAIEAGYNPAIDAALEALGY